MGDEGTPTTRELQDRVDAQDREIERLKRELEATKATPRMARSLAWWGFKSDRTS